MRYFYDTEFIEDGKTIDLISIAVVADDGREYYAHLDDYDQEKAQAHPFVAKNVLPHVKDMPRSSRQQVREGLADLFLSDDSPVDLWGYFSAWDHIALMQLWGDFSAQPSWLPMRTNDICTLAQLTGQRVPGRVIDGSVHDALSDAHWTKNAFYELYSNRMG